MPAETWQQETNSFYARPWLEHHPGDRHAPTDITVGCAQGMEHPGAGAILRL